MGTPAPAPTELTKKGTHRLSARFTEWLMGQPAGWITDPEIGISRNEQLKACGNGVVTHQAVAALRDMLAAFEDQP
jgi:DNA (cytosine-5)-methyltransferase 1